MKRNLFLNLDTVILVLYYTENNSSANLTFGLMQALQRHWLSIYIYIANEVSNNKHNEKEKAVEKGHLRTGVNSLMQDRSGNNDLQ